MTRPPHEPDRSDLGLPDASAADWQQLIDYLSGEGTPHERTRLEQRLATDAAFATFAASVHPIWELTLSRPPRDLDAGWAAVQRKADALTTAHAPRRRWASRTLGTVAATLLAFVVVRHVLAVRRGPVYHYRGGVAGATLTLPDHSVVTLEPGSYLGTDPGFPSKTRTLHLFGAAHFTVAHDARLPFIVYVPGVGAQVLGTTFGLRADTTATIAVSVTAGKVALTTLGADGHWHPLRVLAAGEAIHVPLLAQWMAEAGHDVAAAGVPIWEAAKIEGALRRALIRAGAAAAAEAGRSHRRLQASTNQQMPSPPPRR